jgi:polyisoprenoid-binding protein YceI
MRVLTMLAAFTLGGAALAADYPLTGENTKVEFTGKKPDGKHDGGFKKLTGTVTVSGSDPTTAKIAVTIDTTSLYSDADGLTRHLKNADFFDVKTHPTAKFVSTKIEKSGDKYTVHGDLTMCGKTKAIHFPATITTDGGFKLTSEFKLDRTQFGMTYGKGKIDDLVELKIKVAAK